MVKIIEFLGYILVFVVPLFFVSLLIFVVPLLPYLLRKKTPPEPVEPTIHNLADLEYSIKYVSEGVVRAERNGVSESAVIVTINSENHYFSIYDARAKWYSKKMQRLLEVPGSLFVACTDSVFMPLLAKLKVEIEAMVGPLVIDLTRCKKSLAIRCKHDGHDGLRAKPKR